MDTSAYVCDIALAASKAFRVHGAVSYDHPGKHAAFGPFDYKG